MKMDTGMCNIFISYIPFQSSGNFSKRYCLVQQHVAEVLDRMFQKHGAVHLYTPLLMPRSRFYETSESYVCLMDRDGGLVALPYDLRVR